MMEDFQCRRSQMQVCTDDFKLDAYDYVIVSDASSYTDYVSAHAALVLKFGKEGLVTIKTACGSNTMTETGRAEFNAVLLGLHTVDELENGVTRKRNICVLSDREDLVGSIRGIYKRKANRDLWASFEWYSAVWDIDAYHVKRNTFAMHNKADCIASELRIVLNDFLTSSDIQNEAVRVPA